MRIQLPADIPVQVDASVGAGEVVLLDQSTSATSGLPPWWWWA